MRTLEKAFPGATLRPFALTMSATALLCVYYACSWKFAVPSPFLDLCDALGFDERNAARQVWSHVQALFWLLALPLLGMAVTTGTSPRELGLGLGTARREWLWILGLYALLLPVLWFASELPSFRHSYPRLRALRTDGTLFVACHLIYLLKWTSWEFFFRGFLLFGLFRDLRGNAVAVSTLGFALMHLPKPSLELYGAVVAGPALCFLALRGKSIWPGVVLHWATALTMDLFGSTFWR